MIVLKMTSVFDYLVMHQLEFCNYYIFNPNLIVHVIKLRISCCSYKYRQGEIGEKCKIILLQILFIGVCDFKRAEWLHLENFFEHVRLYKSSFKQKDEVKEKAIGNSGHQRYDMSQVLRIKSFFVFFIVFFCFFSRVKSLFSNISSYICIVTNPTIEC